MVGKTNNEKHCQFLFMPSKSCGNAYGQLIIRDKSFHTANIENIMKVLRMNDFPDYIIRSLV